MLICHSCGTPVQSESKQCHRCHTAMSAHASVALLEPPAEQSIESTAAIAAQNTREFNCQRFNQGS